MNFKYILLSKFFIFYIFIILIFYVISLFIFNKMTLLKFGIGWQLFHELCFMWEEYTRVKLYVFLKIKIKE